MNQMQNYDGQYRPSEYYAYGDSSNSYEKEKESSSLSAGVRDYSHSDQQVSKKGSHQQQAGKAQVNSQGELDEYAHEDYYHG
jgi:hypothetical protein